MGHRCHSLDKAGEDPRVGALRAPGLLATPTFPDSNTERVTGPWNHAYLASLGLSIHIRNMEVIRA